MSDLSTTSWSEVDASNNQTPPEGWPAGMNANAVEPSARMNMGAMKRFWNRVNPVYLASLTTTDTYAVTETQAMDGYRLYEKRATRFPAANVSTSVTINHSALGAQFFKKWNAAGSLVNIAQGDIQAQEHEYYWDGTQMVLLNPASIVGTVTSVAANGDTSSGILVSGSPITASGTLGLALTPSRLATKASPTSADSVLISDAAASSAPKTATLGSIIPVLSVLTNSLGNDVALNNTATYFDRPSVAQGSAGTWFVSGTVTMSDGVAATPTYFAKLWDGTTVIASGAASQAAAAASVTISLSGFIKAPAGNLKISVEEPSTTTGAIKFNATGNSKDSTITAIRIA